MPDDVHVAPSTKRLVAADSPVLVFGGCYSNLQATRALLAVAGEMGIPPARMICTGDVIAYGADPAATLDLIRSSGIATVMGNCEESLAAEAADCGCGFAPGSACERLSVAWFAHAAGQLDAEARGWMAALPRQIDLLLGGRHFAIVHGAPSRINRFVFASTPAQALDSEFALAGADAVIGGHCGLPFTHRAGHRLWHNAGAIGMPANDATPRGWFSLLVPTPEGILIRSLPLAYDHQAAAHAMRAVRLPEEYAAALEIGLWPSVDILPPEEQSATARPLAPRALLWPAPERGEPQSLPARFGDPSRTVEGAPHASVALARLSTLWFNTGTLCNIACIGCYIESTPQNDRLVYLGRASFDRFMQEAGKEHPELAEIGFTGGEPFMNPAVPGMIEAALDGGYRALVLTNAMRPMQRHEAALAHLLARHGDRLAVRVSLDHFTRERHEHIRGPRSFAPALTGLAWLARTGFSTTVAARLPSGDDEVVFRAGFATLFRALDLPLDAHNPAHLVLFPDLADATLPPEVSEICWQALQRTGREVMCASSRMIVHRKGEPEPSVVACTLQPYERRFDLGPNLAAARRPVRLNHHHCARFCVFGAASCTAR